MKEKTAGTSFQKKVFSHDQLWAALRDVEDLLDRLMAPGFVTHQTADCVVKNKPLEGEGITIGLRRQEFTADRKSMFKTLRPDAVVTDTTVSYEVKGVPITIKTIKRNYAFLQNMDKVAYLAGDYYIANPFATYWKARHIIQ